MESGSSRPLVHPVPARLSPRIGFLLALLCGVVLLAFPGDVAAQGLPACPDADEDGYALCSSACEPPAVQCGDCDDSDAAIHPGVPDTCDCRDNDCNGIVDDFCDADADGDGLVCGVDNCPFVANPNQADLDDDGLGDLCDNCPTVANPGQPDLDVDGRGDACDNCPATSNPTQSDQDQDGFGDACDICPSVPSGSNLDADDDGLGDACDNCPSIANANQADADHDLVGDVCDNCPTVPNAIQADDDGDGYGNSCDNCRTVPNPGQEDCDANGVGNACDECFEPPPGFPNPCGCGIQRVTDVAIDFQSPAGKGSGLVTWQTKHEHDVAGFNVVTYDSGPRVQLNLLLIPCQQCSTGLDASYAQVIPKHKGGHSIYIELVHVGGAVDTWGPAARN
jgi:hypothetical protein